MPSVETNASVEVEINVTTESPVINVQIGGSGSGGSGGMTEAVKQALLDCFEHVAWIDDQGQTYYNALYDALYPPRTLVIITAVFNQGSTVVYDSASLDSLKSMLTVTALYDDSSTDILADSDYTLSGTLEAGTSTVTVTYNGKTATFAVNVTAVPTLSSISAVYTQSGTVYDTDTLDSLKDNLVVTAHYSDSSTQIVAAADYTLSGTLAEGTSTITVSYGAKTDTFSVTVVKSSALYPLKNGTYYFGDNPNSMTISNGNHVKFEFASQQTLSSEFINLTTGEHGESSVINNKPLSFTIPASQNVTFTVENVVNPNSIQFEMNFRKALASQSGSFRVEKDSHTEGVSIVKTLDSSEDISCLFMYFDNAVFPAGTVLEFDVNLTVGNDDYIPGTYPLWTGITLFQGAIPTRMDISNGNHVKIVTGSRPQCAKGYNFTTGDMYSSIEELDNLPLWFSIPANVPASFVIENIVNNEGEGTGIPFATNFRKALDTTSLSFSSGTGGHYDGVSITKTLTEQEDASCLFLWADDIGYSHSKTLEFDVSFTVGNTRYI